MRGNPSIWNTFRYKLKIGVASLNEINATNRALAGTGISFASDVLFGV